MVQHLGQRQHAFRLGADMQRHVGRSELEHRALEHVVFADSLRSLSGEAVEYRGKVLGRRGFLITGWSQGGLRFGRRGLTRLSFTQGSGLLAVTLLSAV